MYFLYFAGTKACFMVSHSSKRWGNQNSWTLGTCSNASPHVSHATSALVECCLTPGEYTLTCKDASGNGWHGGYVTITHNGITQNFCENFSQGSTETHQLLIGEDTVTTAPDGNS